VPHALAVVVDEFKQRSENMTYIGATIFVERDTQKGIVIGQRGQTLKAIGKTARAGIEKLVDTRVFLELWVKVRPKWRKKEEELARLGYAVPKR
jgi:GTP-binding protein Era